MDSHDMASYRHSFLKSFKERSYNAVLTCCQTRVLKPPTLDQSMIVLSFMMEKYGGEYYSDKLSVFPANDLKAFQYYQ